MWPKASHLSFAPALAVLAAVFAQPASAAPLGGGAGPARAGYSSGFAGAGRIGRPSSRGGVAASLRAGRSFGFGTASPFGRGAGRFGRGNRFGYGYGYGYLGLPIGYGSEGLNASPAEPIFAPVPQWPVQVGIPASPVAPPAIYVIGGSRRAAAASGARPAGSATVTRGTGQLASAPRFITVPSGR